MQSTLEQWDVAPADNIACRHLRVPGPADVYSRSYDNDRSEESSAFPKGDVDSDEGSQSSRTFGNVGTTMLQATGPLTIESEAVQENSLRELNKTQGCEFAFNVLLSLVPHAPRLREGKQETLVN
jgi:hypothetical protein